jgi:hypothetical protein
MLPTNREGRPPHLTHEIIYRILEAIPEVLVKTQVAYRAKIPHQRLHEWLKWGAEDLEAGTRSIYAQLAEQYNFVRSGALMEYLTRLGLCPKNYGALTWILEKCFKDEFEAKSEFQKQLEDYVFNRLPPLIDQGGQDGAKEEMDSRGDQTPGSFAPGTRRADGQEDTCEKVGESGQV